MGPGDVDLWRHNGSPACFWVDTHGDGQKHECYQLVKVSSRSSHVFFGAGTALSAFSVPALVRYADSDGTINTYAAVAITLDDRIGPDNVKNPTAATHRLNVVLAPTPPAKPGTFLKVPIKALLPPEGEALQQPLPGWCTAIHAAFVATLTTVDDANASVKKQSNNKLVKAASAAAASRDHAHGPGSAAAAAHLGVGRNSLRERNTAVPDVTPTTAELAAVHSELAALHSELVELHSDVDKIHRIMGSKRGKKGDLGTRMSDVETRMGEAEKRLPPKGKKPPRAALTAKDAQKIVADVVPKIVADVVPKIVKAEVSAALKRERDDDERSGRGKFARSVDGTADKRDTCTFYQNVIADVVHGNLQEHQILAQAQQQQMLLYNYQQQQQVGARVGGMHVGGMVGMGGGMGGAGPATSQPLTPQERELYAALSSRVQNAQPNY